MAKPLFIISCPIDTYSGYGARSRDIVKAIIELDKYEVKILPQKWGETPWKFISNEKEWSFLKDYLIPNMTKQPDIWMQITIPNEFSPVGKFNIGCSAGIETNACHQDWIHGLNRMDVNFVSSEHSQAVFRDTRYEETRKDGTKTMLICNKPIEILFEGLNLEKYKTLKPKEIKNIKLTQLIESFAFLFVGHFISGDDNKFEDRKNVNGLIKEFLETFKNRRGTKPALILKMSGSGCSYSDRYRVLKKIDQIKKLVSGNLPNIYLLHGELSDEEMNELYNHPRIKVMVSLTRGEGYGRPLLEFTQAKKPVIASGWSGQKDFLDKDLSILLPGKIKKLEKESINQWFIPDSQWFDVDVKAVRFTLNTVYNDYEKYLNLAKKQGTINKEKFSYAKMKEALWDILKRNNAPTKGITQAKQVKLNLPKLKKKGEKFSNIPLPTVAKTPPIKVPKINFPKLKK